MASGEIFVVAYLVFFIGTCDIIREFTLDRQLLKDINIIFLNFHNRIATLNGNK